jgi:hypothetical protein
MNPASVHVYELRQEVITTCKSCGAPMKKVQRPERGILGFEGAVRGRSLWVLLLGLGCGPQTAGTMPRGATLGQDPED